MDNATPQLVIGRVVDVYGLKGWVKVKSFTDPESNFLNFKNCFLKLDDTLKPVSVEQGKVHGKGLVVKFEGLVDRTAAEKIMKSDVVVELSDLPELDDDEYYWHQLQGLSVWTRCNAEVILLGKIDHLLETGSNDVLVVYPCEGSCDKRQRLLPYRPEVVLQIDLKASKMIVDWDKEF